MGKNKAGRYLLYAIGEIILVVVGILIALAINNANDKKKQRAELSGIFNAVEADLKQDTLVVNRMIAYYEVREKVADSIATGKLTGAAFKTCLLCGSLVTTYVPLKLNDKGYNQLKSYNQNSKENDSLAVEIVQFYSGFLDIIEEIQLRIEANTYNTLENWRDTQPWFSSVMAATADPRFFEYLQTEEYRNRVAYFNIIACKNMLPIIKGYKTNAEEVLRRIAKREETVD